MELKWVMIPFPKTLSDEGINRDLVCAYIHLRDSKDPDIHVLDGRITITITNPLTLPGVVGVLYC